MADEPKPNSNIKPKIDAFTAKVVGDPANPQETLLLTGFLGASSDPNYTRLYTDITLDQYVDIATSDIVHTEPLPKEESPLGGSYVWIKKQAEAVQGAAGPERRKARFLEGPIAAQAAGAPGMAGGAAGGAAAPIHPTQPVFACYPTLVYQFCRTHYIAQCGYTRVPVACPPSPFPHCPPRTIQCPFAAPGEQVEGMAGVAGGMADMAGGMAGMAGGMEGTTFVAAPPIPPSGLPQQCITVGATVCFCPSPLPAHCPSIHGYHCPSVAGYQCPSVQGYHCPSVAGYQCPSIAGYQCPSVAGYHCPSIAGYNCPTQHFHCPTYQGYHCPSVQNYQCPPTDFGPHCNPTPNPVHCPTPNMMCPNPTGFECPSVTEICASSSPLFCAAGPAGPQAMAPQAMAPQAMPPQAALQLPPTVVVQQCGYSLACHPTYYHCPPRTHAWYICYTVQACQFASYNCPF